MQILQTVSLKALSVARLHSRNKRTGCQFALALFLAICSIPRTKSLALRATCSENFSPCTCNQEGVDFYVTCTDVQPSLIKEVFNHTTYPVVKQIEIILPLDSEPLPADILSRKIAEYIIVRGKGRNSTQLSIDIAAFSPSKTKSIYFALTDVDMNQLNFAFLDGFANLQSLNFVRNTGIRVIKDIKLLQNLVELNIYDCLGFPELTDFPFGSLPNIRKLFIKNSQDLTEDKLNIILTALNASPAKEALYELSLESNGLTRIPLRLTNFPLLARLNFNGNNITYLELKSIGLGAPKTEVLSIGSNKLANVEPGAFVGDFSQAKVYLNNNNLTGFYEPVYKDLLQSMFDAQQGGMLYINNNPFLCDCTMAWLIVRHRDLLHNIDSQARCCNGKLFTELDYSAYALCS